MFFLNRNRKQRTKFNFFIKCANNMPDLFSLKVFQNKQEKLSQVFNKEAISCNFSILNTDEI